MAITDWVNESAVRVQATFKLPKSSKRNVDLASAASGREKSEIVDEAIGLWVDKHRDQLHRYLAEAQMSLAGEGALTPEEILTGQRYDEKTKARS